MSARIEPHCQPESSATDANGIEPRLSSEHVDRVLTHEITELVGSDDHETTPMDGVWLAVAAGVILWALIAGVVLLLT